MGLFRVERQSERENYANNLGNDILGWHGCQLGAVASILKTGLRIAPNGVLNGKAYGQGLYFADCSSKSANYTKASGGDNVKVLFLCKIALGREKVLYRNDEQLPSTLGLSSSSAIFKMNVSRVAKSGQILRELSRRTSNLANAKSRVTLWIDDHTLPGQKYIR